MTGFVFFAKPRVAAGARRDILLWHETAFDFFISGGGGWGDSDLWCGLGAGVGD
jgi:hypothetical protein